MATETKTATMTRAQVCATLQVSKNTLVRLRKEADFPRPIIQHGNCVRWSASEIEAWIVARQGR